MAQDLSAKKSNFISNCVTAAQQLKDVRDKLKALAELQNSDATYSGIQQADIVGSNSHVTPTIINNFLQVVQPAIESAISAHLANLIDMLP